MPYHRRVRKRFEWMLTIAVIIAGLIVVAVSQDPQPENATAVDQSTQPK